MKLHIWLACVGLVSVLSGCQSDGAQKVSPANKSERGETCLARNDCVDGLACINGQCMLNEYPISVQARECVRIDCAEDADCCVDFVPDTNCPTYQTDCEDNFIQSSCDAYNRYCICNRVCDDQMCVIPNICTTDTDCILLQGSGVCDNGVCVECLVDVDCPGDGICNVDTNRCISRCTRNEECDIFEQCNANGECEESGCNDNRECYFATGSPLSECHDGECRVPCENDAECNPFDACQNGLCVFVGCTSDEQCRILLGLENRDDTARAVCREPD